MKVVWAISKGSIEVEGADSKECFSELAGAVEVFQMCSTCGSCGSTETWPVVRDNKGVTFYEMRCGCGCSLALGQRKSDGALFPRRTKDGDYLPNGGWQRWQGSTKVVHDDPF